MNNELLTFLLKLKFVEGYRTYIAAVGLLGLAVYLLTQGQYEQAMQNFFTAMAALGIRDKLGPTDPQPPATPQSVPTPPDHELSVSPDPVVLPFPPVTLPPSGV